MGYDLRGNLYEVFVETMATENDCRLNSMQAAGKNIEERCAELLFLYCRHWRNTVVVELLDMDSRLNRFGEENENMGKFDGKGLLRLMVHAARIVHGYHPGFARSRL